MLIEKLLKVALLGSTWVMYLLLLLSVGSIATMIERWVYFRRHSDDIDELGERLVALLERGDTTAASALLQKSPSVEAAMLLPALRYVHTSAEALEDAVQSQMLRERRDLERGMTYMGTLGNNAPFVGLFGTVIGVIIAFQKLGQSQASASMGAVMGGIAEALIATGVGLFGTVIGVIIAFQKLGQSQASASMGAVMGGIAEALIATGVGLFVALPAVVAYNIVQKAIADIEDNVTSITKDITALLKAGQRMPALARQSVVSEQAAVELDETASLHDLAGTPGTN
jgi:biopolymer transport protein ExbB/biopolymer transport protein TolQ